MIAEGSARSFQAQVPRVGGRGITLEISRTQGPVNPVVSFMNTPQNIINFVDPV
jgi:hypothetical protein